MVCLRVVPRHHNCSITAGEAVPTPKRPGGRTRVAAAEIPLFLARFADGAEPKYLPFRRVHEETPADVDVDDAPDV